MSVKSRSVKSLVSVSLLCSIVAGSAGLNASIAEAAAKSPFTDVASGHWAEKHIDKLALQGLLKGDKGKFNPNGVLSREDAVIIAIRFMGQEEAALSAGVAAFPSTFYVDDYAKAYVNYAIKQKLITSEQFALAEKESKVKWGKAPATREWISKLLVRAIGLEADAAAAAGKATSFADNSAIDKDLLGYVNVAVAQGLVKGVEGNKFAPKTSVNRATIATLFSRAEAKVQTVFSGQTTGVLLAAADDKVTLLMADGTTKSFAVTADTLYSRVDSETLTTKDGLKQYGTVSVIASDNGQAAYIEQVDDTAKVKTVQGKLVLVSTTKHTLTLLNGEEIQSYEYDASIPPVVTDSEKNTIALTDLPANSELTLTIDTVRAAGKILAITLKQSAVSKSGQGTVVSVNAATRTLQIKDSATGVADSRVVADTAIIRNGDGVPAALTDLKVGDAVNFEVKNGLVTSLSVTKSVTVNTLTGVLFKIDAATQTVLYTSVAGSNDIKGKLYATGATVKISGLKDAGLGDLLTGDAVTLTLNDTGKVSAIEVSGRSVQVMNGAVISSYDNDAKLLIVKDTSGSFKSFTLGTNVRYDLNGTVINADYAAALLYKNKKIDIGYSGSSVVTLSFVAKYTGTVAENNTVTRTLKINLDNGTTVSLSYLNPTIENYGFSAQTFADIKVGDKIAALLDANQSQAVILQQVKNVQFEVVSVDTASNKLRAKRSDGAVEEWAIGAAITLKNENDAVITLGGLTQGTMINVTFQGNTPVLVKAVPVAFGRVVSVDVANASLDLQTGSAAAVKKSVGATPVITRDGVAVASLASVQPDDRVEISKDESDRTVIRVISALRKSFWYIDTSTSTLYYKKENNNVNDTSNYVQLSPQVYIHQGTTTLTGNDLNNNDAISIYMLRGKAVEIVK